MAQARYYSPRLDRDLVTALYHRAKTERVPMTRLASALVRNGLAGEAVIAVVREEPPIADPSGRTD